MQEADRSALRAVGSTGSPLADEAYQWIWDQLPRPGGAPMWIACISGGTDFAGAFVAGNRTLPLVKGEMQCRCLGAAVQAFVAQGRAVVDEVGELVTRWRRCRKCWTAWSSTWSTSAAKAGCRCSSCCATG